MNTVDVLYFFMLMMAVGSHGLDDTPNNRDMSEIKDNRIVKRDASIIIDSFPIEPIIYRSDPTVIYKRVIKRRNKPKYGPPKTKYRSLKTRKPYKYGRPSSKKRPTKPRYGPPKSIHKPVYGPPKKSPAYTDYESDSFTYGEPSSDYTHVYEVSKPHFAEPPSYYSVPLKQSSNVYVQSYEPSTDSDHSNYANDGTFESIFTKHYTKHNSEFDDDYAHTKTRPVYVKPDNDYDEVIVGKEPNEVPDIYKLVKESKPTNNVKKRKPYKGIKVKKSNWKVTSPKPDDDEILIGGQYAEPPARYVPKFRSGGSIYVDEDIPSMKYYLDPDELSSATISPYVNYKNSNMAFSPQNLNDAFSIIEA